MAEIKSEALNRLGKRVNDIRKSMNLSDGDLNRASQAVIKEMKDINRNDRLRGVDRNGNSLQGVRYRPKSGNSASQKTSRDRFGNLNSSTYKTKSGPPLVPDRERSRLIKDYFCKFAIVNGLWKITAGWKELLSSQGKPFLQYHVKGGSRLAKREIGAISAATLKKLQAVFLNTIQKGMKNG